MSTHEAHGAAAHGAHDHAFDGEPVAAMAPDEPRTPGWLPALGAALFVAAAVWFLAISKGDDAEAAAAASAPASASAAAPVASAAPPPRPTAPPPAAPPPPGGAAKNIRTGTLNMDRDIPPRPGTAPPPNPKNPAAGQPGHQYTMEEVEAIRQKLKDVNGP